MKEKKIDWTKIKTFDQLLEAKYGPEGTEERVIFEMEAHHFYIAEMMKQGRKEAKMTQAQLAEKIGTKKSYISKIENGKGNITLDTLYRIFKLGLNKDISININ